MADDREAPRSSELLQVLDAGSLPLDVFDMNIWAKLRDGERGNLRLTCHPMRRVAHETLSAASFGMMMYDSDGHPMSEEDRDAASLEVWQRDADARSAFLVTLPRLTDLLLYDWMCEADLMRWLLRFSNAGGGGKITTLRLDSGQLTLAGGCAIQLACPRLQHLTLGRCVHDGYMEFDWETRLSGDVFLPLRASPITSLTMGFGCTLDDNVLSSLNGLSNLQSLRLDVNITSQQLHHLRGMVNLRHCEISPQGGNQLAFVDAAAVFSLTKLTLLELSNLAHSAVAGGNAWQAAVTLLGGLVGLQSIKLGELFTVDDAVMAALQQLTQLTALAVGGLQLSRRSPGLPPGLRSLCLQGRQRPAEQLRSLQALLPLPHLTDFHFCSLDISCVDSGDVAVQAAALARMARLLAAVPRLRMPCMSFMHGQPGVDGGAHHLSMLQVIEAMQPLALHVSELCFSGLSLSGTDWGEAARVRPGLQCLELQSCTLSNAGLAALAVKWGTLGALKLHSCTGVTEGCWAVLCAARTAPLRLSVYPKVSDEVVADCRELQESAYGRQHVVWV